MRFPKSPKRVLRALEITIILSALASCAQYSPVISATSVQFLRVETEEDTFEERLSVFVFWGDGDGSRDFSSIRVVNGREGLEWTIDGENAAVRIRGKDRWVGSAWLAPPIGESLPSGEYDVIVSDLAGNEASSAVVMPEVEFPDRSPITARFDGDRWTVSRNPESKDFSRVFFLLEDDSGKLLYSWRVPETRDGTTSGTLTQLKALARNATRARCYAENGSGTAGVLLRPAEME